MGHAPQIGGVHVGLADGMVTAAHSQCGVLTREYSRVPVMHSKVELRLSGAEHVGPAVELALGPFWAAAVAPPPAMSPSSGGSNNCFGTSEVGISTGR